MSEVHTSGQSKAMEKKCCHSATKTMFDPRWEALPVMRKIKAKKIVADIRARVSDFELMSKYGLSLEQLEKVLGRLLEAGEIRGAEIEERGSFFDDPANRSKTRRFPRIYLRVPLEIEDLNDSANKGLLIDLSDDGFRTRGIAAVVGEEKVFLVSLKEVRKTDS